MFQFKFESQVPLLTVIRTGFWSLATVASYEVALRIQLAKLRTFGHSTAFIIDIRSSGAQSREVADALRAMVERLGPLHANKTAIVTSSGLTKLQAKRIADVNTQVFTSMVLARDWATGNVNAAQTPGTVHNEPSGAEAEGLSVHVQGPSDVDVTFTPAAALETAKRISDAAVEALLVTAKTAPAQTGHAL